MAYALVGSAGTLATGTGSLSPTFGQATTAANLLIACVYSELADPSTPSGWSRAINQPGAAAGSMSIFYKENCGAGETAPTFTAASSGLAGSLAEFSGGATTTPADKTGGANGLTSTQVATTGGADTASGQLVIAAGGFSYTMAATKTTSHTLNNGASATNLANNDATSTALHFRSAYGVTTGNSAADSTTVAFTTTNISVVAIAIASFKLPAAAGNPTPPYLNMAHSGPF